MIPVWRDMCTVQRIRSAGGDVRRVDFRALPPKNNLVGESHVQPNSTTKFHSGLSVKCGSASGRSRPDTVRDGLDSELHSLILILAAAVVITTTRNWNSWEGGHPEQLTDDAYVRGDLTPLSTKAAGIVRDVKVADYQQVHKGDLLVELEDDDYQAQAAQADAAVEAAMAALENNRRQRELQDSRIERALVGIDQASAQIAAAEAGKAAVAADVVRTQAERKRQEGLVLVHATTQQHVEIAVADADRLNAQFASREADLTQANALLKSNESAVETERRTKSVLESQGSELVADLSCQTSGALLWPR